jgi:hypothetical protein
MTLSSLIESDFMKLTEFPDFKKPNLINFAATDFVTLRDSLIKYIKAVYPNEYQYFAESDLGMMFIELVAYMGAVMSMKTDMLANENFFVTARQRSSVKKLLELIGTRMRGPLSAAANAQVDANTISLPTSIISLLITAGFAPTGNFIQDFNTILLNILGVVTQLSLVIDPDNRVITIPSPEDGGLTTYTLYRVQNGIVESGSNTGFISLDCPITDTDALTGKFNNLVLQEGSLVIDRGDFASTESIKTINLTQSPVVDGSMEVFITSTNAAITGAYKEVPNIYFASGVSDKIFEVVYDDNYAATIVFGDGTVGVSPDDNATYTVLYRVGGGTRGNILKSAINTQITANLSSVATVFGTPVDIIGTGKVTITNTSQATGGSNAETLEEAKRYAPLNFRRQDRLVTLEDYSVFANTYISKFGSVGKASAATRKAYCSGNIIDIYILEKASELQLQKATPTFKTNLLEAINKKKMVTDEIVIVDGLIRTLDLIVTIKIDKEQKENESQIVSKVRDEILKYMKASNREFGESLRLAELNRKIFETEEVIFSTIDNLDADVKVDFNEIIQLNNLTINIELLD